MVVIGGGITGAGILSRASQIGLRAVLLEAADFASGTSSHSSKLVHGGLRYLRSGQFKVTFQSVRGRDRLLMGAPGLVRDLPFLFPSFQGRSPSHTLTGLGLSLFDLLAGRWTHESLSRQQTLASCPSLTTQALIGGHRYQDAQTDDARLVLRLIQEAGARGAVAINYAPVIRLLRDAQNRVAGVGVEDRHPDGRGRSAEVIAKLVINATGPWADEFRSALGAGRRLRPLRGSHLVFSRRAFPVDEAITVIHPTDGRPTFVIPWEGVTLFGTTDIDHDTPMDEAPAISPGEYDYLMSALRSDFRPLGLEDSDVLATFSGVRPVIDTGKANPSKESRDHVIWDDHGLMTVTGGKLTTFEAMADDALRAAQTRLNEAFRPRRHPPTFESAPVSSTMAPDLDPWTVLRLSGRYGQRATEVLQAADAPGWMPIPNTPYGWPELAWAARSEDVVHLDDLLLRRLRVGLILERGGQALLKTVREVVQRQLGWDDDRWDQEAAAYMETWRRQHNPNPAG